MLKFVLLPHQLFEIKYLNKKYEYIIWEHPHYFKKYNYNKKKILLHHGSMKYYFDYLIKNKFKVKYLTYNENFKIDNYFIFDPIDKIQLPNEYTILESPNFLLTCDIYKKYREKSKHFLFNAFYTFGKKEIDVIPNIKSKDKYNRKKIPKNLQIPKIPNNIKDNKYINIGIEYVNKNFNKNYGNTDNFSFPLTHKTANSWLNNFISKRFEDFGQYQDAILKDEEYMFHSVLSTSINIGLLNPSDIIKKIMKIKKKININSFEGYIRQLFWREYQRYCYIYYDFENKNYFGNNNKLTQKWYTGNTGIEPIDDCIKIGFETGYLNHISRLMIIGNFMNLSGIHPKEGHKWFMEFSCDSYEWVMAQNVYDMVFFVSGGITMRKPYITSSNYILKMSDYKKDEWCQEWDEMYRDFLKKHKKKLWKFRYHFRGLK
jgi:deoxyribodipyrimidine photolyase-related protein